MAGATFEDPDITARGSTGRSAVPSKAAGHWPCLPQPLQFVPTLCPPRVWLLTGASKDGLSFSAWTLGVSLELLMGSCCHQGMKTPSLLPSRRQRGTGAKTAKWQQLEARLFPWISVSSSVKWICHRDLPHWVASHQRGIIYRKLSEVSCTREC